MKYSIKFYNRLTVEISETRIAEPRYVLILYAIIDRSCFTIEDLIVVIRNDKTESYSCKGRL